MITLISPYSDITSYPVRILSACLRSKGFKSRLIFLPDLKHMTFQSPADPRYPYDEKTVNQVIDLCRGSSLIGISFFSSNFPHAVYLTKRIKERLDIPVVWGGKHPSAQPEDSLLYTDMVCIGEGEEVVAELLGKIERGEDYHDTQNMWFKRNGTLIKNPNRPLLQNLDMIPFPDYSFDDHYIREIETNEIVPLTPAIFKEYLPQESPTRLLPYETLFSRGCPYSCTYCYSFKEVYAGQKYLRFRSIENIMQELELMKAKFAHIQMIWFVDDNIFVLPIEKIKEFCRNYKERIGLPMSFAGHPLNISEEKLAYFTEAGMRGIHMGVQSGSQRIQRLYKRRMPEEKILKAVHAIHRFKDTLVPVYDFITDNPYETNDDIIDSIKLALKFPRPRLLQVFSLMFFPGTELREQAEEEGLISKDDKTNIFRRDFGDFYIRKKKYLNLVFPLFNLNAPNFIIKILINKHVVALLDRPMINEMLFGISGFLKKIRDAIKIRRNT